MSKVYLDEYDCEFCGLALARNITPTNIEVEEPIKYCPFCGEKYSKENDNEG